MTAFQLWMETHGELFILCLAGLCFVPVVYDRLFGGKK